MKAVLMKTVEAAKALVSKVSVTQTVLMPSPPYMINSANGLSDSRLLIQNNPKSCERILITFLANDNGPKKI